jgi:hypothetical protein
MPWFVPVTNTDTILDQVDERNEALGAEIKGYGSGEGKRGVFGKYPKQLHDTEYRWIGLRGKRTKRNWEER